MDAQPYRADYYPVLGQLMKEMNLAETINKVAGADDSQAKIDVGTFACLMIHNLLGDVNIRLYTMDDFFEDKALPLLIPWKTDIDIDEINNDRAARVLDAIWEADPQKAFSAAANQAILLHKLETDVIHGDTTSKSFYGAFENLDMDVFAPIITFGNTKDHRPDLKQLIFGVGTTADGVPVVGEVADVIVIGTNVRGAKVILRVHQTGEITNEIETHLIGDVDLAPPEPDGPRIIDDGPDII